jgi:hypothetical protein
MIEKSHYNIGRASGASPLLQRLAKVKSSLTVILTCGLGFSAWLARADQGGEINLDSRLLLLSQHAKSVLSDASVAGPHSQIAKVSAADKTWIHGRFDEVDRVLVHVMLNGQDTLDSVALHLESLQGHVLDRNYGYRHGVLTAYLPTDELENAAALSGVRAMTMEYQPEVRKIGKYSSQARFVLQTDVLNKKGLTGKGIIIGALSDSFNTAQYGNPPSATTAAEDVKMGYLPAGVNVLQDYGGPGNPGTDEGRAILQVLYSEAIDCTEAFATADVSEVGFANNIVALRTQANCAVIDDDVGYYDEPVFSDGMVANAVNTVVTTPSSQLPGVPVVYTSSAGNDGNNGYRSAYRELTDNYVRQAGNHGNLNLDNVPAALTKGGWHNWNPNGGSAQPFTAVEAPGPVNPSYVYAIFLQWDDPFDQDHGITTNYNFLVFDVNGNYLPDLSSTTNSFSVQQPIQGIGYLSLGTVYQIAVTKTTQTDKQAGPIPATHQLAMYTTLDGLSDVEGTYFQPAPLSVPNIYGHPAADSAIAVAAYAFNWRAKKPYLPTLDNFTSPGPVFIYFDQNQNRLSTPVTRAKPEVAGVDGVLTDFFGSGYYNYPFAFFGTSCAAPTVAGVAALMLEENGGAGSLTAATVKAALENSAAPRTTTPGSTQGLRAFKGGYVSVTALGQSYFGPNYFTLNYLGPANQTIDSLTIDGEAAGLIFNTKTAFAIGSAIGVNAADVTVSPLAEKASKFTLTFKTGTFVSGASISFTAQQNEAGKYPGYTQSEYGSGSDAEDLGYGATFKVKMTTGGSSGTTTDTITVPFQAGSPSTGYGQADGYGLINAVDAVNAVAPTAKPATQK